LCAKIVLPLCTLKQCNSRRGRCVSCSEGGQLRLCSLAVGALSDDVCHRRQQSGGWAMTEHRRCSGGGIDRLGVSWVGFLFTCMLSKWMVPEHISNETNMFQNRMFWNVLTEFQNSLPAKIQFQSGMFQNCHPDMENSSKTTHYETVFLLIMSSGMSCSKTVLRIRMTIPE